METYTNIRFNITCTETGETATIEVMEGDRLWPDAQVLAAKTAARYGFTHYSVSMDSNKVRQTKTLEQAA
jgi:hypothetical protein